MTLHEFVIALRSGWWIVVACTFLGIAFATGSSLVRSPSFTSTATLFIATTGQNSAAARQLDEQFVQSRATTYAALATTTAVLQPAADGIAGATAGGLRTSVAAAVPTGTSLVQISATAKQAVLAAKIADSVAASLAKVVNKLEGTSQATTSQVVLHEVQSATPPTSADGASPLALVLIGAIIGAAAGVFAALLVQAAPRTIRTAHDVATVSGLGSVAIPREDGPARGAPNRREAYRFLRARLRFVVGSGGGVVVVAPVDIGASARESARMLAEVLVEYGARALLVDADGERSEGLDQTPTPDRAETAGHTAFQQFVASEPSMEGLEMVEAAGGVMVLRSRPARRTEGVLRALSGEPMRHLLEAAARAYDYVVVVAPSVLDHAESAVTAAHANATVLTVSSRATRRRNLVLAIENLQSLGTMPSSMLVALTDLNRSDVLPARGAAAQTAVTALPAALHGTAVAPYQFQ